MQHLSLYMSLTTSVAMYMYVIFQGKNTKISNIVYYMFHKINLCFKFGYKI
ncbi:Uncharacterised protein [Bacillus cereus]|nr:Uncharacterised protein [Bacillus cereus]